MLFGYFVPYGNYFQHGHCRRVSAAGGRIAVAQGVTPELYTIPAAIAASCAFMLPVATPPNAIVFSSNVITIGAMIRAGFALNIISAVIIEGFTLTLVEVIF